MHTSVPKRLVPRLLRALVHIAPVDALKAVPGMRTVYNFLDDLAWTGINQTVWEIEGSKMYLDPWDGSAMRRTYRSYLSALKEPMTTRLFKEAVHEGDTVIDVGANIGFFSLFAARLVGKTGRVYAFEPEPRNFQLLTKNIALNMYDNVVAYQKAVWRHSGRMKLYLANVLDTGAHTLRARHDTQYFDCSCGGQEVEVESIVMDSFLPLAHSASVIKMDIEGAEVGALEGMGGIIQGNPRLKLFMEFFPEAMREMGDSPEAFIRTLRDYGFSAMVIDELETKRPRTYSVSRVDELLSLCDDRKKIVNLLLTRQ